MLFFALLCSTLLYPSLPESIAQIHIGSAATSTASLCGYTRISNLSLSTYLCQCYFHSNSVCQKIFLAVLLLCKSFQFLDSIFFEKERRASSPSDSKHGKLLHGCEMEKISRSLQAKTTAGIRIFFAAGGVIYLFAP